MSDKVSAEAPAPDLKKLELRDGWLDDVIADAQQTPEAIIARLTAENERLRAALETPFTQEDQDWVYERANEMHYKWLHAGGVRGQIIWAQDGLEYWAAIAAQERLKARAALKEGMD
jgi:hypothetical protein